MQSEWYHIASHSPLRPVSGFNNNNPHDPISVTRQQSYGSASDGIQQSQRTAVLGLNSGSVTYTSGTSKNNRAWRRESVKKKGKETWGAQNNRQTEKKKKLKIIPNQAKASQTRPPKNDLDFRPHPTHPMPNKPKKATAGRGTVSRPSVVSPTVSPVGHVGAEGHKRPGPLPRKPSHHVTQDGVDSVVGYIEKRHPDEEGKREKKYEKSSTWYHAFCSGVLIARNLRRHLRRSKIIIG